MVLFTLTWHLRNHLYSDVGEFLHRRFSHVRRITFSANEQLKWGGDLLMPNAPYCPYGTLERAFNRRIRYSFERIPSQELAAWNGAFNYLSWDSRYYKYSGDEPYSPDVLTAFFDSLEAALDLLQSVGRPLETESEQILARYCFVLALLEEVFYNEGYRYSPLVTPKPKKHVDELLAIPQEEWIDDLCSMFKLFYERYAHILSLPCKVCPQFMGFPEIDGEDSDKGIIVDDSLIEIKASVERRIQPIWLRHLIGCVLLDVDDLHHIKQVAIYMARQGRLVSWPLDELLCLLTDDSNVNVSSLRQELRSCYELSIWSDESPF